LNFLLDTNVISEWVKPRPDPGMAQWLAETDEDRVFISVVTLAELRQGVELLASGERRNRLDGWLRHDLPLRFEGRILIIDAAIADTWGRLMAQSRSDGRPVGAMDTLIAATAKVHDLTIVTRNTVDFKNLVPNILNPWSR
jgi:toxin FitB